MTRSIVGMAAIEVAKTSPRPAVQKLPCLRLIRTETFRAQRVQARVLLLALVAFLVFLRPAASAQAYALVPEDKIRVVVVQWQPEDGQYKKLDALGGEYVVNESGDVSIPVLGEVPAAGLTTAELAGKIGGLLKQQAGLGPQTRVSVEIAEFGPIFVTGAVDKPGRYSFSPGLTVSKAVSLAGGIFTGRDGAASSQLLRDQIDSAGKQRDAKLDRDSQLMRRARLEAELKGQDDFESPAELAHEEGAPDLHAQELNLMHLRRTQLDQKIAADDELRQLYEQEVNTLQAKIAAQKDNIEISKKELDSVNSLVQKGLAVSSRQLSLAREISDAQIELLDLELGLLRVRQSLRENERDKLELRNSQRAEIQKELNDLSLAIAKSELQMRLAEFTTSEIAIEQAAQPVAGDVAGKLVPHFSIVRDSANGSPTTIDADQYTLIEPRDLVEVRLGFDGEPAPVSVGQKMTMEDG